MLPIMVAAMLGCGQATHRESHAPLPVVETPAPVVMFRLLIIREWDSPWYVIETEDHDWTLQEAIAFGIPAELWIKCAIENPGDFRQEIYWVRPLHA